MNEIEIQKRNENVIASIDEIICRQKDLENKIDKLSNKLITITECGRRVAKVNLECEEYKENSRFWKQMAFASFITELMLIACAVARLATAAHIK